jgi:phage major head subunit gpT-like protein
MGNRRQAMVITPSALNGIFVSYNLRYQAAFDAAKPYWNKVATLVPSTTDTNTYGWMNKLPKMREWTGDRLVQNASLSSYTLQNKDYEGTLALPRNAILDDQIGIFTPQADMLGNTAALWPDDLISDLIINGGTYLAFDGQYFFDVDHPVDLDDASKGIYSNYLTTLPLNPANFQAARAAMQKFRGVDGRSLKIVPNVLMVPPDLEKMGREILNAMIISNTSNVLSGMAELIVNQELTVADEWYLFDCSRPIKPFVFQQRQAPVFVGPEMFPEQLSRRKEYVYSVDSRGNAGYSLPFLALKAKA